MIASSLLQSLVRPLRSFANPRLLAQPQNSFLTMGSSNTKKMKNLGTSAASSADASSGADEYIEGIVCQESDLTDNQMREFDLEGKGKVLVVKQGGKLSAIGPKCSHYGAPLSTGALGQGRVRCPWHGACFNTTTGDIEDFPGLDSIQCFQVKVETGGAVKVRAHRDQLANQKRVKTMTKRDPTNKTTFIVVGGGAAGSCAVETLRQEGFSGRLVLVGKEPVVPYDRIKLSKALDMSAEKLQLRTPQFYSDNDIETMVGNPATALDAKTKTLTLGSGEKIQYDAILLASGSQPRRGGIPGSELKNVHVLRDVAQANAIAAQLTAESKVVVVGASFIGMEVASFCVSKVASVTVLVRDSVPFRQLGQEIGKAVMDMFVEKGVKFEVNCGVEKIVGDKCAVKEVELTGGQKLPADAVVLGIGSTPCTEFLANSGVELDKAGNVVVDKYLQSNVEGVFAGGDIAFAPVLHTSSSIGHWQLAHYHGRMAALNMLGRKKPIKTVPFFWTMFFGKSIRYAGYAPSYDSIVINGNPAEFKFVAYYCTEGKVLAVATAGSDPIAAKFAEVLAEGRHLTKTEVETNAEAWAK